VTPGEELELDEELLYLLDDELLYLLDEELLYLLDDELLYPLDDELPPHCTVCAGVGPEQHP